MSNETKTLAEVLRNAILSQILDLRVALPAKVEKYNIDTQTANVKPLIKKKYKINGGVNVSLPVIPNVPVQFPSGNDGKTFIHFPLKPNDLGVILVCDRSIDLWLSGNGDEVLPSDTRHHNLSDAIFIPGVRPTKKALKELTENMLIKNDKIKIELFASGKIKIEGTQGEMLQLIVNLIEGIMNANVNTMLGPQKLIPVPPTLFQEIKTKFEGMKG